MKANGEINLTNLEKIFWPEEGYTKGDVINYYEAIADVILPYVKDRPMVLHRHPHGIDEKGFFQKQIDVRNTPSWVKTFVVEHSKKSVQYLLVQDKRTLLYVANLGCIELNPFHSRFQNLDYPDYLVIDIDPEDVPFDKVIEVALVIHKIVDDLSLDNYCKTSGGRGLHIYIPTGARYDYSQVQSMAKIIALLTEEQMPNLISLERSPARRQKKIYIDWLRNAPMQTVAAPYCVRPRQHAPVSTPLDWQEVCPGLDPSRFNIETIPQRLKERGDIFKAVLKKGVNIKRSLEKLLKN